MKFLLETYKVLFAGCFKISTVFSHAQTVVACVGCATVLCQPTGGKAKLTDGNYWISFYITVDTIS